ncbi:hypothetical protein IG631_07735 [Alternaria alternata]|nr:hypothetical protein IG631_07735 [Alternaria alternata]
MEEWRLEALKCRVKKARWWLCDASDYLGFADWLPVQATFPLNNTYSCRRVLDNVENGQACTHVICHKEYSLITKHSAGSERVARWAN